MAQFDASDSKIRASDGAVAEFPSRDVLEERASAYSEWSERVRRERPVGHETIVTRADPLNWAPLNKPLAECTVALVSTGGVHLKSQEPFAVYEEAGDWSSRSIPGDADTRDLVVTHTHYATQDALQDVNVMFPLDRLRELADQGTVARASSLHFGFMGFIPDPTLLLRETAPAAGRELQRRGVDVVVLTPG